jgi:isochorismate hydrolase
VSEKSVVVWLVASRSVVVLGLVLGVEFYPNRTKVMWVHLMVNVALVVIDMQLGNFESNPVHMANDLLAKTESLIQRARALHLPIICTQNNGGKGDPDEYGSEGWKIRPSIAPIKGEVLVQKKTPDAFHETNLDEELKSRQITRIIAVGLQTNTALTRLATEHSHSATMSL